PVSALTIGGTVYEDRPALALPTYFAPLSGVSVKLYSDGGAALATKQTNAAGRYTFTVDAGDYWIVVDSRSVRSGAWPNQTYGPTGAQCIQIDGTTRTNSIAGPCFGGRIAITSDDASTLTTSRHVAHVSASANVSDADFGFSFNVVTTTDDSPSDDKPLQGSLRQFLVNANAISGANTMRFVPLQPAPEPTPPGILLSIPPRWWTIHVARALPELRDDDTTIDGTAYNFLSSSSIVDVNPGRIGERGTVDAGDVSNNESRQPKPELEIITVGDEGIACTGHCTLRMFATYGARVSIVMRADAQIQDVIVGSEPDSNPAGVTGEVGVQIERGTTTIRGLFATDQTTAGVAIATTEAKLDGERMQVSRCGTPTTGAGVALIADGSTLRSSWISANDGAGIIIGSPDGKPARNNTIETSTISGNLAGVILSPGAANNLVTHCAIMWNRIGGVIAAGTDSLIPRENRITANWYNENGGRPISIYRNGVPNMLAAGAASCGENTAAGVAPPVVDDVHLVEVEGGKERVIIRGRTCPNHAVEIYQSFVTTEVREKKKSDLAMIRKTKDVEPGETVAIQDKTEDKMAPSIGEFNYVGATKADADGRFEASFPFARTNEQREIERSAVDFEIWGRDVLESAGIEVTGRAFSAVSIDARGNTSEVSARRRIN
ncbi:MAG TPA: right-handed parallel beta-helix repeat-containing protein, partial [Thermoanaerobaculia bacterium]|nr:right-handed parallel beta-helix repeat-containing protein [Thermoanaerobaculia bacterium]